MQAVETYSAIGMPKAIDIKDPMISPIYGSFAGFPPTYIQVGENEVLLSDSTMLHKKMIKENVSVKIDIFKGIYLRNLPVGNPD